MMTGCSVAVKLIFTLLKGSDTITEANFFIGTYLWCHIPLYHVYIFQTSPHHGVGKQLPGDAISPSSKAQLTFKVTSSVKEQLNPTGVTECSGMHHMFTVPLQILYSTKFTSDLASVVVRDEQRDAIERRKKQEEYHHILDQQLAEHKQRKQQELMKKKLLEADDIENISNPNTSKTI